MNGKLCLYCSHFYVDIGSPRYSELTPGSNFEMSCAKNVWLFNAFGQSQDAFRRTLERGLTCVHFEKRA